MTIITKGANTPVPAGLLRVAVCRRKAAGAPAVEVSALLLDAVGKVRGDADLVFHSQPVHPSGAVRHIGTGDSGEQLAQWLELDLPRVEPAVQRVLIAASCDDGTFGAVPGLAAQTVAPDGTIVVHYEVTDASTETAFVLGEFYRRDGQWKFRAVGQGYDTGLAGLATDFGIVVAEPRVSRGPVVNPGVTKVAEPPAGAIPAPAAAAAPTGPAGPAAPTAPITPAAPTAPITPAAPAAPITPAAQGSGGGRALGPFGPEFRPWSRSGRGSREIAARLPAGPVIVEAEHEGEGLFGIDVLDADKQPDRLVHNTVRSPYRGRSLAVAPEGRRLRLRVEAQGAWKVTVLPVSAARPIAPGETVSGSGPEVLRWDGPAGDLQGRFDGGRNAQLFCVDALDPGHLTALHEGRLLFNEMGRVDKTVPLSRGPVFVTVKDGEGAWRLKALPIPVLTTTAAPADGVYQGRRDAVVTLVNPWPGRPALLEYDICGAGRQAHTVTQLDEYGDSDGEWMNGTRHGRRGSHLLFARGQERCTLEIRGTSKWRLRVRPVEEAPLLKGPVEGTGSTLLRYQGPPTLLRLFRTTEEAGYLVAHAMNPPRGQSALVADTDTRRRPVVGPVWVDPEGLCCVRVQAGDGVGWRVEPVPLDEAPVIGGRVRRVAGKGFGVVRHTGPETEMLVTHDYGPLSNLIPLIELDENLFPVRRVARSLGHHRIPAGFLQVRGLGEWELERRG
ncbi:TerD family protein [Streptomyces sp. FZ201]|uniref:TerD family protein n=1 Tax=Streptomyces sp. FZ201 TaxID=3057122 RepID=UPI0021BFCB76|nr:TerD family protein [Streptomyces sp. FZ201]